MKMNWVCHKIVPFLIRIGDWGQIGDFFVSNDFSNEEDLATDGSPPQNRHSGDESALLRDIAAKIDARAARYRGESRGPREQESGPGSSAIDAMLYTFKVPVSCLQLSH